MDYQRQSQQQDDAGAEKDQVDPIVCRRSTGY